MQHKQQSVRCANPKAVAILRAVIHAQCFGECEDCFEDGLPCWECRTCRQKLLRAIARKLGDNPKLVDDFSVFMKSIGAEGTL
jgi:hypothetical protein